MTRLNREEIIMELRRLGIETPQARAICLKEYVEYFECTGCSFTDRIKAFIRSVYNRITR